MCRGAVNGNEVAAEDSEQEVVENENEDSSKPCQCSEESSEVVSYWRGNAGNEEGEERKPSDDWVEDKCICNVIERLDGKGTVIDVGRVC